VSHNICQAVLREEVGKDDEQCSVADMFLTPFLVLLAYIRELFWTDLDCDPFWRIVTDILSYMVFLGVLMYSVVHASDMKNNRTDLDDLAVEIYICLYVLSIAKKFIMVLVRKTYYVCYHDLWTVAEILMVLCFLSAGCARAAAEGIARSKGRLIIC
jgi:hypothetical protein